jgi:squalene-hopene/tetraprenyl-beta-curcumene cyclase
MDGMPGSNEWTSRRRFLGRSLGNLGVLGVVAGRFAWGQVPDADPARTREALIGRGVAFLRARQTPEGTWSPDRNEPGLTALAVTALLRSGRVTPDEPVVTRALEYLLQFADAEGGLAEAPHANYTTAIALLAFQAAQAKGERRYDDLIASGQAFLKRMQWDQSEGKGPDDPFYGGAGYGGRNNRPDLSNTSYMIEALRETGLPPDDPALQKALVFVSRCQNLDSEYNDQPWAKQVNDGGFIYTAAFGGQSMAGEAEGGGLRSYAGMTYAGLKSMIYAGLTPDDPRVQGALRYIKDHYTLDENPGLGQQGLYYYYHTFAKAMALLSQPTFEDADGTAHDWRAELTAALAERQNPDGSWVNPVDRFMEGDPNLVTAYSLLALDHARG